MSDFFNFLVANWHLTALFFVLLATIVVVEFQTNAGGSGGIVPELMTKMMNRDHAVVFDTRDSDSFNAGHVVGSIRFDLDNIDKLVKKYQKNKAKPVIVVDQDGRGFAKVIEQLKEQGFTQVFGLKGGIAAWREAGYPLVKEGE